MKALILGQVDVLWTKISILRHLGAMLGVSRGLSSPSWEPLGAIFEAILEPAGGLLGPPWGHPGPQKAGTPVETAGKGKISILRHLGAILRLSWGLSGHILGLSCATWGYLAQLGASWGPLWAILGMSGAAKAVKTCWKGLFTFMWTCFGS